MKIIVIGALLLFFIGCSRQTERAVISVGDLKKSFLMSKDVYSIDRNVDAQNQSTLYFRNAFSDQLFELNLRIESPNTSFYSLINSQSENKESRSTARLSVFINSVDVTQCLIDICSEVACTSTGINSLVEGFRSDRIYFDISKLSLRTTASCQGLELNLSEKNRWSKAEFRITDGSGKALRVNAQVIAYRTPKGPNYTTSFIRGIKEEVVK